MTSDDFCAPTFKSCFTGLKVLTKIIANSKLFTLPETHMDGQNFLKVVCGELVGVIRIIGPFNTHHSTKLLDFVSPVCNKTQRMNLITSCNDTTPKC